MVLLGVNDAEVPAVRGSRANVLIPRCTSSRGFAAADDLQTLLAHMDVQVIEATATPALSTPEQADLRRQRNPIAITSMQACNQVIT